VEPLPIDPLLPEVVASLRAHPTLVLEAPPGAGKTTRVPRALLDAGMAEHGEIVILEPRRLAARMAARRVADELGEKVGGTVGYQVRFEDVSGPKTRIRFVTEGVLGRKLIASPDLAGIAVVVLDEFHERHLQGDVALALVERLRRTRRPELRVVVMSATLATGPLAAHLAAPVLRSEGRRFDVAIEHLPEADDRPLALQVASAVRRLVAEGLDGDVLVFLPGAGEIRRAREACEKLAAESGLALVPLHGDLSPEEQDTAVRPGTRRKVILSTNVAESSITIQGVVAVVDAGLARVASQAPWSGLPRLRVEKVSRASAVQRAGRAGRTRPGRCLRLYTRADFESRPEHEAPEIRRLDLAQTELDLAALGAVDVPSRDTCGRPVSCCCACVRSTRMAA
jgi:ATP-dependent helicase HrpB